MKAHQGHTKDFEELTYAEQAKSINAYMAFLGRAVNAHLRKAEHEGRDTNTVREKCVRQAKSLLKRIEESMPAEPALTTTKKAK